MKKKKTLPDPKSLFEKALKANGMSFNNEDKIKLFNGLKQRGLEDKDIPDFLDMILSEKMITKEILSKHEKEKPNSPALVETITPITIDFILEALAYSPCNELINAIELFKSDIMDATQDKELKRTMFYQCDSIEWLVDNKKIGEAISLAYDLGKKVMIERGMEYFLHKSSGRPPVADDPIFWGKKMNDYRKAYKGYQKNPKSRNAARFAMDQTLKDWEEIFPKDPVTGIQSKPISEDAIYAYEKMYLESLEQKK